MEALLTIVRAVHFGATISLFGTSVFAIFIAKPVSGFRNHLLLTTWIALVLWFTSLLGWLVIEAMSISGQSFHDVFAKGALATVLVSTRFGHSCALRSAGGIVLALCLLGIKKHETSIIALIFSGFTLATLAWFGHAGAVNGRLGYIRLMVDGTHLLAAGAWLGGLLPLVLLYSHKSGIDWRPAAQSATRRFSTLGLVCVGAIIITGTANAVFTVGSVSLLTGSDYGHLLLVKLALFAGMVAVAALNRLVLMPRLCSDSLAAQNATESTVNQLRRNTLIEAMLGAAILLVVGILGTSAPPHPHSMGMATEHRSETSLNPGH